jgi:hypothetical protein
LNQFFVFNLAGILANPCRVAGDCAFTAQKAPNDDELLVVWDGGSFCAPTSEILKSMGAEWFHAILEYHRQRGDNIQNLVPRLRLNHSRAGCGGVRRGFHMLQCTFA